jgi:hypothetical protein
MMVEVFTVAALNPWINIAAIRLRRRVHVFEEAVDARSGAGEAVYDAEGDGKIV